MSKNPSPKVRIQFDYSREDYAFLKGISIRSNIPFREMLINALNSIRDEWIEKLKKKNEEMKCGYEQLEIK